MDFLLMPVLFCCWPACIAKGSILLLLGAGPDLGGECAVRRQLMVAEDDIVSPIILRAAILS